MLRAGMHAEGSHVCMVPMEEGRCRSKGEMDHIGPVGRKGIVADGSRIGLADFHQQVMVLDLGLVYFRKFISF